VKLSESIRLGAMLHPQAFGAIEIVGYGTGHEVVLATCALGAAKQAGYDIDAPVEEGERLGCPGGCCYPAWTVLAMIAHLNDFHHWTRERIADFVQTLEESTAVDAVDPHVADPGMLTPRVVCSSSS